ncbi:SDR family NAD(P)-dependent oxidoreductase [Phenylobacterium sp.]|jgi:NAD(P)-dependent dehydrogenase (short-subunit alcohol dehydrogenase family)|uniref:SDR family NAD(P)-dependent oxidoreductase n=1 Tax=Phenylobacterium sp. TaxID=1871053 RepID=UPI002F3FE282
MTIQLTFPEGCALVAGGAGSVGAGVTRTLAQAGLHVTFTYLSNSARAERLAEQMRDEGLDVRARQMDLRDAASIDAALAFAQANGGRLHTVACASGAPVPFDNLADFDIAAVEDFFSADGMANYRLVNRAVPVLRSGGGGSITLCTTIALYRVIAYDGISPFSKGAVEALVRQIAWEEARHGIRCNAVPISWVESETAHYDGQLESMPSPRRERVIALMTQIKEMLRMPGPARPDEAGALFAFLASDQARFITGQSIAIDGGATL